MLSLNKLYHKARYCTLKRSLVLSLTLYSRYTVIYGRSNMDEKISVNIEQELSNIVLGAEQLLALNHQIKFHSLSDSLSVLCADIKNVSEHKKKNNSD